MKATVGPVVEAVSDPSALRIMRTARSRTSAEYLLFLPMVTILPREMVSGKPGAIQGDGEDMIGPLLEPTLAACALRPPDRLTRRLHAYDSPGLPWTNP